ncbi:glycosyltransferase family 2 protein [Williamsia deligens]|uniref:Glycosyltransferase family 2 protein n=1 Tax=Williamsia deligens TaxID=321325 RepID=A0ABW3G882_9NOCA|nr:galactosyltransferase-related protein [Williamsia deligens]MCP2192864.1 Glycosyltransferase, GT2 family [Williamsia deligens]
MTGASRIVVVTVVRGRHQHLRAQRRGLAASTVPPFVHVVVAMDDPDIDAVVAENPLPSVVVACRPDADGRLPLARARNVGAAAAGAMGATLLVFLDVDCIPGPDLIARYADAAARVPGEILCGPVTYLPPGVPGADWPADWTAHTHPHPARPAPAAGELVPAENPDLFWSLSFAVAPSVFDDVGGFCAEYAGYGCEDTDFAATAVRDGTGIRWVGGAHAYHQHHPVSRPPVEHLDDIVANSSIFHRRWGRWPMEGWLSAFEDDGLLERTVDGHIAVL